MVGNVDSISLAKCAIVFASTGLPGLFVGLHRVRRSLCIRVTVLLLILFVLSLSIYGGIQSDSTMKRKFTFSVYVNQKYASEAASLRSLYKNRPVVYSWCRHHSYPTNYERAYIFYRMTTNCVDKGNCNEALPKEIQSSTKILYQERQ